VPLISVAATMAIAAASAKVTKEVVTIDRDKRPYYLFVPDSLDARPVPLLIVLHGSGRDGKSLVDPWRDLASREGFIVAGPDAADRRAWIAPDDGPAFLYFLAEAVKAKHAIDSRRMYLFGHSAGAGFGLTMALMESEYFAAAAVHAGALQREGRDQLLNARRKIPMAIFIGTRDPLVPLEAARESRDVLTARGFSLHLVQMADHDHNYYQRAPAINQQAWDFLKSAMLAEDPRYQIYSYAQRR
jgi:poly(3-hydroxybutyrate) depolymerase